MIKTSLTNDFTDHYPDDDSINESYRRRVKTGFREKGDGPPARPGRVSESSFLW